MDIILSEHSFSLQKDQYFNDLDVKFLNRSKYKKISFVLLYPDFNSVKTDEIKIETDDLY